MYDRKKRRAKAGEAESLGMALLDVAENVITGRTSIRVDRYNMEGDVVFSVPIRELGRPHIKRLQLRKLLGDRLYCDFLGELLLRRHVEKFLEYVCGKELYEVHVHSAVHEHFGAGTDMERAFFIFHVSKLSAVASAAINEALQCNESKSSSNP